jgi:hypothetical protein
VRGDSWELQAVVASTQMQQQQPSAHWLHRAADSV